MTELNPIDAIVDNILVGDSALDITNSIKDALMVKASAKIDIERPNQYNSIFTDVEESKDSPSKDDLDAVKDMPLSQKARESKQQKALKAMYDTPESKAYARKVTLRAVEN